MADGDKKESSGGSFPIPYPESAGGLFLWIIVIFILMYFVWWITGGITRSENAAPYVESPTAFLADYNDPEIAPAQTGWQNRVFQDFSFNLPPGWYGDIIKDIKLVARGTLTNGQTTLSFEYGLYTNAGTDKRDPRYTVNYQTVAGNTLTIYTPKFFGGKTIFFYDRYPYKESLIISGIALSSSQKATALAIARSVRFSK